MGELREEDPYLHGFVMQDLFSNLTNIMGKRPDDPAVVTFLDELGETPDIKRREGYMKHTEIATLYFPAHGFTFEYDSSIGHICFAYIHCRTPENWFNPYKVSNAFAGSLPASVSCSDDRETVNSKLKGFTLERTYQERTPRKSSEIEWSDEQALAHYQWVKGKREGKRESAPEIIAPIIRWSEEYRKRPETMVVDVYEVANLEWHFFFLIEDQRLLGMRLYMRDKKPSL